MILCIKLLPLQSARTQQGGNVHGRCSRWGCRTCIAPGRVRSHGLRPCCRDPGVLLACRRRHRQIWRVWEGPRPETQKSGSPGPQLSRTSSLLTGRCVSLEVPRTIKLLPNEMQLQGRQKAVQLKG